jgi:hypothetical protein
MTSISSSEERDWELGSGISWEVWRLAAIDRSISAMSCCNNKSVDWFEEVPVMPDGEQPLVENRKQTKKVGRKPVVVCPHDPYA